MRVEFDKMEGAGNDFIFIDSRDGQVSRPARRNMVIEYCHRNLGIGADGMIFIEKDPELDFAWDFYNSDGSSAEMCGNGARCAAVFANKIGAAGPRMRFRSLAGPIQAELTPLGAKVGLGGVMLPAGPETLDIDGVRTVLWFLNTGVPHAVVEVHDVAAVDVRRLGAAIRRHARFAPAGTNANFFALKDGDNLAIRTFERGVEDETLACGTGSIAAALTAGRFFARKSPVTVKTKSGAELAVHFRIEGDKAEDVKLEGGARLVFSGHFDNRLASA